MSDAINREVYDRLTVDEKIQLVHDIWDDIARRPESVRITPAQHAEAERRLKEFDDDPAIAEDWDEVRRRIERGE
jgi:putative addiction module component (TIGR02574 family)